MPLEIIEVLITKKGIWWEEGRTCKNFEKKDGRLHYKIAQIWQTCQGGP